MTVSVSIAIWTWNRAKLLDQTLAAMRNLVGPPGVTWELLVVNNNCTDETDSVLVQDAARLPLQRLFEPTPGRSHARNTAVAHAQGDLMLWTDDDVPVDPQWLAAYVEAAKKVPDAAFFGVRIAPGFGSPIADGSKRPFNAWRIATRYEGRFLRVAK